MIRLRIDRPHWIKAAATVVATVVGAGLFVPTAAYGASEPKTQNVRQVCKGPTQPGEMTCFAMARTNVKSHFGVVPQITPNGYGPADLRSAYAFPSATAGIGQTIAIVDAFDNPNAEADLAVYRAQFGLTACTTANGCFRKVNQNGQPGPLPVPNAGWAAEIALDLDMASAVCPNCNLLLVEANSNFDSDLFPAVNTAAAMGAKFVSLSWGGSEFSGQTQADQSTFNHPGVVITAASGDNGFGVIYPSSSQFVTAVGGTSLTHATNARGWAESAWSGAGSGCSLFENKPTFQTDTGCTRRVTSDVSAVADPQTGVAVYNTFQDSGWVVFGGTSASTPIIASAYALAGPPAAGTYPNSYPYATPTALFDVTTGANGVCGGVTYLCTAGPGYDGPTGLGTPNGVLAFGPAGPHGVIAGTVTDSGTGAAIVGALVVAGTASSITDAAGRYSLGLSVGTYDVMASSFGYQTGVANGVVVTDSATTTTNFALVAIPHVTLSGTVRDGSGHGWPLYARISVDGFPGGPIFTDPATGHYAISLPGNLSFTLTTTAKYPGYLAKTETVALGGSDQTHDIALTVDPTTCGAPGYRVEVNGLQEAFSSPTTPAGWSVVNNTTGGGWGFTDLGNRGNLTGGTDGFAMVDSDKLGIGKTQDTELRSPVLDLTNATTPVIGFNQDFRAFPNSFADLDLSLNGGATWTTLTHQVNAARGPRFDQFPIPQAAGVATVQVRWRYVGTFGWWWEVDNVFIGQRGCAPNPGALVLGRVTDANTGAGLNGATVTSNDQPTDTATSMPTPDDPVLGDGFYWMFSSLTGSHPFTASLSRYTSKTTTVNVVADAANLANFALDAGHLTVSPATISGTVPMGGSTTATVNVHNDGGAPAAVTLSERDRGFVILKQLGSGPPINRIQGTFTPLGAAKMAPVTTAPANVDQPQAPPWVTVANLPAAMMDNASAADAGRIYSVGGYSGTAVVATGAAFTASTGTWAPIASMNTAREKPVAAFVDGKMYVVGGWGLTGDPMPNMEIYDPGTNTWSAGPDVPTAFAGSAVAVIGGRIYVIGGCDADTCGHSDVWVFDTDANTWTAAANYPQQTSWLGCGAISGRIYCGGGTNDTTDFSASYSYDPATNAWSPIASMPIDLWGGAYVAANGLLLISGGVTANSTVLTNQGYAYDPVSDTWTAIANSNNTVFRGGAACGFYKIGGSLGGFNPTARSEVLPGFEQCAANEDVPWLSEAPPTFTVAAGATVAVTLTLNASTSIITQPGAYSGRIVFTTDTPYTVPPVDVTMNVTPPKDWGKIMGTVTGAGCSGPVVLAGATVQINSSAAHYTLTTDANGGYALWLDKKNNPLTVIVAKDSWQPQTKIARITAGRTLVVNWSLLPARAC
jgi:N-acetylneuraminic acid mutarotase